MVQTELHIGSELKPHYQEKWEYTYNTTTSQVTWEGEWPMSTTWHGIFAPGKTGSPLNYSPEYAQPYDTHFIYNGEHISIQDDCGIYPTQTIYPQDGSKYHLEITGNHTASVDITPNNSYSLHYEDSSTDSEWDVEWSMSSEYHVDISANRKKPASSFYNYTIYMQENGRTIDQTIIDSRTTQCEWYDNGVLLMRYDAMTDTLYGFDSNGNIDFQSELIPTGYYSGTGSDERTYYGAFTTTNKAGYMISVRRISRGVWINLHSASDTWAFRDFTVYNEETAVGTVYSSYARAYEWATTDVIESGVLPTNVTALQGIANGYNFDALTYQEAPGSVRRLIVFDMAYNPDGTAVMLGNATVAFKETYDTQTHVGCYVSIEHVVPLDDDDDTDSDTDTDLDTDTDTDNDF